jgi:hypothetical protein
MTTERPSAYCAQHLVRQATYQTNSDEPSRILIFSSSHSFPLNEPKAIMLLVNRPDRSHKAHRNQQLSQKDDPTEFPDEVTLNSRGHTEMLS